MLNHWILESIKSRNVEKNKWFNEHLCLIGALHSLICVAIHIVLATILCYEEKLIKHLLLMSEIV